MLPWIVHKAEGNVFQPQNTITERRVEQREALETKGMHSYLSYLPALSNQPSTEFERFSMDDFSVINQRREAASGTSDSA